MINKILLSKAGTITDLSNSLEIYRTGTSTINLTINDYLYVGQFYPFNHLYLKVDTANTVSATMVIQVWTGTGNKWITVADFTDETSSSGKTFAQPGFVTWTPNKYYGWSLDDTVLRDGSERIEGLGDITIYDRYWVRIAVSGSIDATTKLKWAGNLFSDDGDLISENALLLNTDFLTSWETGKATWEEQHVRAASILIDDLTSRKIITSASQIIDRYKLKGPATIKTIEIIYAGLGSSYDDDRKKAREEYESRIKKDIFNVDRNNNAILDSQETRIRQGEFFR